MQYKLKCTKTNVVFLFFTYVQSRQNVTIDDVITVQRSLIFSTFNTQTYRTGTTRNKGEVVMDIYYPTYHHHNHNHSYPGNIVICCHRSLNTSTHSSTQPAKSV